MDAIRYDLDGDGSPDNSGDATKYGDAFPISGTEAVCESGCNGYELNGSLDFDNSVSYASGAVNTTWTTGNGWDPIGDTIRDLFEATFDGNGNTISNLHINRIDTHNVGLFSLNDLYGIIRNIGLVDVDVSGKSGGGLAGFNSGTIIHSYATGSVSGSYLSTGGLVGKNYGTISHSYASVAVSGKYTVGGLAGDNFGTVMFSHATGRVSSTHDDSNAMGGLVGSNGGTIRASYATGYVSGVGAVGGLAGRHPRGTIISSYATGSVGGVTAVAWVAWSDGSCRMKERVGSSPATPPAASQGAAAMSAGWLEACFIIRIFKLFVILISSPATPPAGSRAPAPSAG